MAKIDTKKLIGEFEVKHNPKNAWKAIPGSIIGISIFITVFLLIIRIADADTFNQINDFVNSHIQGVFGILLIILLLIIFSTMNNVSKERKILNSYERVVNEYANIANPILENNELVCLPYIFNYIKNNQNINSTAYYYFLKEGDDLSFLHTEPLTVNQVPLELIRIPINSIKYFEMIGERFYENKISGGGSQKPNIMGAIIGEEILGTAGAVVGGQQKIDPIKSELVLHDERRTRMVIKNSEMGISEIFFDYKMMEILKNLFPDKSKEIVEEIIKNRILNKSETKSNIKSQFDQKLELLDKLLSDNVIDEEEYNIRKKKLIDDALN